MDVLIAVLGVVALLLAFNGWAWWRAAHGAQTAMPASAVWAEQIDRLERSVRQDVLTAAQGTRQEVAQTVALFQQSLLGQQTEAMRSQQAQMESVRRGLVLMQETLTGAFQQLGAGLTDQSLKARAAQDASLGSVTAQQSAALNRFSDTLNEQLRQLGEHSERRLNEVRATMELKLGDLQKSNEQKLEQMRVTVDEKLHATLEQRLGESFKQVADRLDQVHRGLGEMQVLARDVGALHRVLTNVKTRGIYGEVQLAGLLEQVLTPEQYAANVETVPGSGARVEFAVRLPGRRDDGLPLWLPIDAKFPREDHERLLEAQDRGDQSAVDAASKAIEVQLRVEARRIRDKYVAEPHTTDFAILFVPSEGLYAEALRRPGLAEALQRDHRVMLTGPTTLLATLSSLQMGFRTLALERRSAEVWEVLGAVKTEFGKFGDVLAKTKKKLHEAASTIDSAELRTRQMAKRLRGVEALPEPATQALLPDLADALLADDDADEAVLQARQDG